MTTSRVQVIVGTFEDEKHFGELSGSLTRVGTLELVDAAALLRQLDSRIQFEDTADPNEEVRPQGSALTGELVGLIFPLGTLVPTVGDAGAGVLGDPYLSAQQEDLGDNLVLQMQRLAVLRDRDLLTEAEYQRQRVLLTIAARDRRPTRHVRNDT
jgi:hypothetical protein